MKSSATNVKPKPSNKTEKSFDHFSQRRLPVKTYLITQNKMAMMKNKMVPRIIENMLFYKIIYAKQG